MFGSLQSRCVLLWLWLVTLIPQNVLLSCSHNIFRYARVSDGLITIFAVFSIGWPDSKDGHHFKIIADQLLVIEEQK